MRTFVLTALVVAPLIAIAVWQLSPPLAIGVIALSHALVLYPTLRPNAQWLGPVVTRFETDGRREVWLTIDDGPTEDTPELLDLFDRRGVKATFFVKGTLARKDPALVREIVARGHTVGNHSETHPSGSFWCLPPGRIRREIDQCSEILTELTGEPPRLFRAPVGMKNPAVHPLLRDRQMLLVGWTARGFDGVRADRQTVLKRLLPKVDPGTIIVLHQGRPASRFILEAAIDALQERGYAFVVPERGRLNTNR